MLRLDEAAVKSGAWLCVSGWPTDKRRRSPALCLAACTLRAGRLGEARAAGQRLRAGRCRGATGQLDAPAIGRLPSVRYGAGVTKGSWRFQSTRLAKHSDKSTMQVPKSVARVASLGLSGPRKVKPAEKGAYSYKCGYPNRATNTANASGSEAHRQGPTVPEKMEMAVTRAPKAEQKLAAQDLEEADLLRRSKDAGSTQLKYSG
ncbi:hypothetical protein NDU88_003616 [Pleurodeles waltl]|uniref:Uncharacterized protein n=1 Tax=Pleurodeles waltl TaxID=8319 RepID=A0AAV7NH71_PLEWA|nr:hypothetical protein NDU88_003616 [Pleurodeles waltl]